MRAPYPERIVCLTEETTETLYLLGQGDRIVGIVWQMEIRPGEYAEFGFVARNPKDKKQLVWKLRQRFADGTSTDWTVGPEGNPRPTALTRLTP